MDFSDLRVGGNERKPKVIREPCFSSVERFSETLLKKFKFIVMENCDFENRDKPCLKASLEYFRPSGSWCNVKKCLLKRIAFACVKISNETLMERINFLVANISEFETLGKSFFNCTDCWAQTIRILIQGTKLESFQLRGVLPVKSYWPNDWDVDRWKQACGYGETWDWLSSYSGITFWKIEMSAFQCKNEMIFKKDPPLRV